VGINVTKTLVVALATEMDLKGKRKLDKKGNVLFNQKESALKGERLAKELLHQEKGRWQKGGMGEIYKGTCVIGSAFSVEGDGEIETSDSGGRTWHGSLRGGWSARKAWECRAEQTRKKGTGRAFMEGGRGAG